MSDHAKLQRADRLTAPPVVGKFYLVPAIYWAWGEGPGEKLPYYRPKWWPVWGNKHVDIEFFDFKNQHYHVDPRFFNRHHWSHFPNIQDYRTSLARAQSQPMSLVSLPEGPGMPTLRKMRCSMEHSEWCFAEAGPVIEMNKSYAGQVARSGKHGFICPHKNFALASVIAINGVITCPLHGLRIDATTGQCLGPRPENKPECGG